MNKKTILFIGLMVCFLGVLAYVENIEKQEQRESEQAELKQTEISEQVFEAEISEAKKDDKWASITSEYFLSEDIFDTDAKTGLVEYNIEGDEKSHKMFVRRWYDENDVPIITVTVMEYKDKIFDSENNIQPEPGSTSEISKNTIMTYLDGFTFEDEIINKYKIEIKQGQDVETTFHLNWFENRFSFSIKTISDEYQDDIKEIAENIINKYSN